MKAGLLIALSATIVSGCNSPIYTSTANGSGEVIVLNGQTGTIQIVKDDVVFSPKPPTQAKLPPNLDATSIPQLPVKIYGQIKYVDGKMRVRITIGPPAGVLTDDVRKQAWRDYMDSASRTGATLNPEFSDSEGFVVATSTLRFSQFTKIVDDVGAAVLYEYQGAVEASQNTFSMISSWSTNWSSWPAWKAIEPDKPKPAG